MKFPNFEYVKATSLDHLLDLLEAHGDDARILAGGQSLLASLSLRLSSPDKLLDINGLTELSGIERQGKSLEINALTRHVEVLNSPLVAEHIPLLSKTMPYIAHAAVRNRGTIGGSLSLADPSAELPAITTALDATFTLQSKAGSRTVKAREFFLGLFETARQENEVLTKVSIPVQNPKTDLSSFAEISRRKGDFAIAGLAATARIKKGLLNRTPRLTDISLTYFGVGEAPVIARKASELLSQDPSRIDAGVAALNDDLEPSGNLEATPEIKLHLCGVLLRRALADLNAQLAAT
ncbi:xanthine dehydrogenase family protein subunit M (plasmid) [Leisingera sp. M527]|uniref:FAD binding domain-containing protein n=1 Tax=Leisingera sp. M527 TaxID=2867014 RepID=UPI0021A495C1|nr:xanthine dehydrogenase family protein subunit M [Leisingera sp. M527]UWQ35441.1 xanthine dehydrogenase family protein subunit M [Leisingera sp. M527]